MTNLTTSMMPQIRPVYFELAMIVHMDELVGECRLHMLFAEKVSRAHIDSARIRDEAAGMGQVARKTLDVRSRDGAAR